MKRKLQYAVAVIAIITVPMNAFSQCRVVSDLTTSGDGVGDNSLYSRQWDHDLMEVQNTDVLDNNNSRRDTASYDVNGRLDKVETFFTVTGSWYGTVQMNYNASDQIIRIDESGDNGSGLWTKSFDISYNGSGQISGIILDALSITGSPEGMMANFDNMTYTNGNLTYVDLIGDMGAGIDTYELSVSYDNMNNIEPQFIITEATDLLLRYSTNNALAISFINDETIAMAGDNAIEFAYTYNPNNDVITREEMTSVFNSNSSVVQYDWDCSVGIIENKNISFTASPNPASTTVVIDSDDQLDSYRIVSIDGAVELSGDFDVNNTISVASLVPGVYFVQVVSNDELEVVKIIVQ